MPTFQNPTADAAEASEALRGLAHATRVFEEPADTYTVLGDLLETIEAGKSFKTPGRPAEGVEWGVIKVSAMTWGKFDASENKAVVNV